MNNREKVGNRTEPFGTSLFISLGVKQLPPTTAKIDRPESKLEIKLQREGQNP